VTVIGVPYHLDEYLPGLDLTPAPAELITPELPAGDPWPRLAVLYLAVARAGYRPELIASHLGLKPVPEDQIVLAGARDLDPPEVTYLDQSQIRRRQVTAAASATSSGPDIGSSRLIRFGQR
jgi:hypothetical protein